MEKNLDIYCRIGERFESVAHKNSIKNEITTTIGVPKILSGADKLKLKSLTNNQLIALFKGVIIFEEALDIYTGSTTITPKIYEEITYRKLDHCKRLVDWAMQNSTNEYVPFGGIRKGATSFAEYELIQANKILKKQQEKYQSESRKAEKRRIGRNKLKAHYKQVEKERIIREQIRNQSHKDFLKEIETTNKPIYYFKDFILERLKQLNAKDRFVLLALVASKFPPQSTKEYKKFMKQINKYYT